MQLLFRLSGLFPAETKSMKTAPAVHQGGSLARFSQEKVFKDELPFAGGERPFADPACNLRIDGLRARLSFDDLVKRKAAFAAEQRN